MNQPESSSLVAKIVSSFRDGLSLGDDCSIESCLQANSDCDRSRLLVELVRAELEHRACDPQAPTDEYFDRFPNDRDTIVTAIEGWKNARTADRMWDPTIKADDPATHKSDPRLEPTIDSGGGKSPDTPLRVTHQLPSELGQYEVLDEIARGGMGVVYRVRHQGLNRVEALKMILAGQFASDDEVRRFRAEAAAAAQLDHPGIVPIYEVGEHDGQHYFSMGYVDGKSLAHHIASRPLESDEAAGLIKQLAEAVEYAHGKGIIHRDLKPQNVLLTSDGHPRITDFGLAKAVHTDSSLTATGQVLGTPSYMPPEQARGEHDRIDARADVYSLGAILYCAMCGRPPFQATNMMDTLRLVLEQEPIPPRQLNPSLARDLETICLKCLSKEPHRRYSSAADLASDLDCFLSRDPIRARRMGRVERAWRWGRKRPVLAGLCAALLVAVISIGVAFVLADRARRATALSSLIQRFETGLDEPGLSLDYLEKMELLIGQIDEHDPRRSADAILRLHRRVDAHIRETIQQPRLTETMEAEVKSAIEHFAVRDAKAAEALRDLVRLRTSNWQDLFEMAAPFQNAGTVFEAGTLTADGHSTAGDESPVLVSRAEVQGDASLEAVFGERWAESERLAVMLYATGEPQDLDGYEFVLRPVFSAPAAGSDATRRIDRYAAEIRHGGARLRLREIPTTDVAGGSLRIHAQRDGSRLSIQINQLPPLVLDELFAPIGGGRGRFALWLPPNIQLVSLTASHRPQSELRSVLEEGDRAFTEGQFDVAHERYGQQALTTDDDAIRREAQFKQALATVQLQRLEEAATAFESLVAGANDRWSTLATCQLWLLHLGANRLDQAEDMYNSLAAQYKFEELAVLIPADLRAKIVDVYRRSVSGGFDALRHNPHRIERLERLVNIEQMLDDSWYQSYLAQSALVEAYHIENRLSDADRLCRDLLRDPAVNRRNEYYLLRKLSWINTSSGTPQAALDEIDRRLNEATSEGVLHEDYRPLLIERARLLGTMGKLDLAKQSVDAFFDTNESSYIDDYVSAALLRGVLYNLLGQKDEARSFWLDGFGIVRKHKRMGLLPGTMCGSLADAYTLEDANRTAQAVVGNNMESMVTTYIRRGLVPDEPMRSMLNNMWRHRPGLEFVRRYVFHEVSAAESAYGQIHMACYELWRQCILGTDQAEIHLSDEQHQIVQRLNELLWDEWSTGRVSEPQALQLMMAWKGTYNIFGWSGLAPVLRPESRSHLAYVLGCRFHQLGQPKEAKKLFDAAIKYDASSGMVSQLATEERAKLPVGD